MSPDICEPQHDSFANLLTIVLVIGLLASYIPQHLKIILKRSSEGFSPWFLLLGSTSSGSTMLNMITLQWGLIKCCRVLSAGNCVESLGGVIQVSLMWILFTLILVFYMIYFPSHLKYVEIDIDTPDPHAPVHRVRTNVKTQDWRLSIILSWVVVLHIVLETFVTLMLVLPDTPSPHRIHLWATFLGVSSALSAMVQYVPQVVHTYRLKLVGALSIPMMIIQTPGAVVMVLSIALREGTNWTSWITYAVAGVMQGTLLIMCLFWKLRQRKLGIDDFGHELLPDGSSPPADSEVTLTRGPNDSGDMEGAVREAVRESVMDSGNGTWNPQMLDETAALLVGKDRRSRMRGKGVKGFFGFK